MAAEADCRAVAVSGQRDCTPGCSGGLECFGQAVDDGVAEGGQILGAAAADELAVDDDLLADVADEEVVGGAGVAQVGADAGPGGEASAKAPAGLCRSGGR
ncbi:hypothetical protein [Streptomyces purpurogeneiscleroticus]|uniref:hypothetical protein n=1 Tax=Streptomyces purpurogeneiscleroticus TaxID=68259 RepID=UPI003FD8A1EF